LPGFADTKRYCWFNGIHRSCICFCNSSWIYGILGCVYLSNCIDKYKIVFFCFQNLLLQSLNWVCGNVVTYVCLWSTHRFINNKLFVFISFLQFSWNYHYVVKKVKFYRACSVLELTSYGSERKFWNLKLYFVFSIIFKDCVIYYLIIC
jgi:hypothetical protein